MLTNEIRPKTFEDVVGQEVAKELLSMRVACFKKTSQASGHMLFLGPAGLGKSTLSLVTANAMGVKLHSIMGTRINSFEDLLEILNEIEKNDILFIDEIHALRPKIQEELYGIMEDFQYDSIEAIDYYTTKKVKRSLPHFTVIGATTHGGKLNEPLRTRFSLTINLENYNVLQLVSILQNIANRSYDIVDLPLNVASKIASLSKGNARNSINLFKNLMESIESQVRGKITSDDITLSHLEKLVKLLSIDPYIGLDRMTRQYLVILASETHPLGISTLVSMLNEQEDVVRTIVEPYLLNGDIQVSGQTINLFGPFVKTSRAGREITPNGKKYLDYCRELQSHNWFPNEKLNYNINNI
jgi:Holliday junction DNA helicase RuvB